MRKNMSLCRRVVGTSLLAITLLGMSSVGVNKVAADTGSLTTELTTFMTKFENSSKNDDNYKNAVAALSDEALNYLMLRVVADFDIDTDYFSSGSSVFNANKLNYLGTSNKDEAARKIVFAEMKKRVTERDKFKSENKQLTDENSKLNEK
ncbi:hypothetical protein, partial [Streptococcus canis]